MAQILNKISMVSLKQLLIINIRLSQTKDKTNNNIAVWNSLAFIIIIEDFYQFFLYGWEIPKDQCCH